MLVSVRVCVCVCVCVCVEVRSSQGFCGPAAPKKKARAPARSVSPTGVRSRWREWDKARKSPEMLRQERMEAEMLK